MQAGSKTSTENTQQFEYTTSLHLSLACREHKKVWTELVSCQSQRKTRSNLNTRLACF